ncbi:JmjC-domain-containing protein [Flagelloscypha sp. PMI_526]|nr:JmjC-domain-containing protein [Flagelloscypha sp. PMI_526]
MGVTPLGIATLFCPPMSASSSTPSLTASRSPSPEDVPPITQPDHFYAPNESSKPVQSNDPWVHPDQDPYATRGIPVFKPSMAEFADFEQYMLKIEPWGMVSGIVKVIPPQEWRNSLPNIKPALAEVRIKSPIEQNMIGSKGLFRQENIERRKEMTVREWVALCNKDDFRAPAPEELKRGGQRHAKPTRASRNATKVAKSRDSPAKVVTTEEDAEDAAPSPPAKASQPKRRPNAAERHKLESDFMDSFDPHSDWLPTHTASEDYNLEFCKELERSYWRSNGIAKPPWYGADTQGSLFDDTVTSWNVANLHSTLSRLLPSSNGLPGVNTPYLYFGMWRATFAWHVEDMDLFSINYIHFGAPKFWYAMPQQRANSFEDIMRQTFSTSPGTKCSQFLRHKSYLVSPSILDGNACRKPNFCVQQEGEFMITYPRGYHAGFNLGLNCAESVNFALDSWINIGRHAKVCNCVDDSVRIDVDQLLADRAAEARGEIPPSMLREVANDSGVLMLNQALAESPKSPRKKPVPKSKLKSESIMDTDSSIGMKRKAPFDDSSSAKKQRTSSASVASLSFKIPAPSPDVSYPCCLCPSTSTENLLSVHTAPDTHWKELLEIERNLIVDKEGWTVWNAHEECAMVLQETWIEEVEGEDGKRERMVFGVDDIPRDRWALKCSLCKKERAKAHGALVQCAQGKCTRAFHVSCAKADASPSTTNPELPIGDTGYQVLREFDKDIVLYDSSPSPPLLPPHSSTLEGIDPSLALPQPWAVPQEPKKIVKTVRKLDVTVLCTQHNPVANARKRAAKDDIIYKNLLALPQYARLKISAASSGTFEVTFLRVIPERKSVEVLWDDGKPGSTLGTKEVKWNRVLRGESKAGLEVVSIQPVAPVVGSPFPEPSTHGPRQALPQPSPYSQPQARMLSQPNNLDPKLPAPSSAPPAQQQLSLNYTSWQPSSTSGGVLQLAPPQYQPPPPPHLQEHKGPVARPFTVPAPGPYYTTLPLAPSQAQVSATIFQPQAPLSRPQIDPPSPLQSGPSRGRSGATFQIEGYVHDRSSSGY